MHSLNCVSFALKQTNIYKTKTKNPCGFCTLPIVTMALQTAGRGVVVLLAMLFCLDIQGHAQLVDADVEVGAIFHCWILHILFKCIAKRKSVSPGRLQLVAHSRKTKKRGWVTSGKLSQNIMHLTSPNLVVQFKTIQFTFYLFCSISERFGLFTPSHSDVVWSGASANSIKDAQFSCDD